MKSKLGILTSLLCAGILSTESKAKNHAPCHPICPQFYAGATIGLQRLTGTRTESDYFSYGGVFRTTDFSSGMSFSNNNGFYSIHGGFSWFIPSTSVFIGPEIYVGRGSALSEFKASKIDINLQTNQSLTATIRQHTFMGTTFHIGVQVPCEIRPYLLVGFERSQFEYSGGYVPISQAALGGGVVNNGVATDYPITSLNTRMWKGAFSYGLGIDKKVGPVLLGADIRFLRYRQMKSTTTALAFDPDTLTALFRLRNFRFGIKASYLF